MVPALKRLAALALLAGCAAPARDNPPLVDLRVCASTEADAELYRKHFKLALAGDARGGRECDVIAKASDLDAGKVTLRSAYDGSVLAELEVPVDLAPQLAAFTLKAGSEPYAKVWAQRRAAGFTR